MPMPRHHGKGTSPGRQPPPEGGVWSVRAGQGRTAIELRLLPQGRDWLLLVTGGEAHVGAVAAADARSCELAVLPPHKEGPLARECAEAVARASGRSCAVVAGIHYDDATGPEIAAIVANVRQALQDILGQAFNPGNDGNQRERS